MYFLPETNPAELLPANSPGSMKHERFTFFEVKRFINQSTAVVLAYGLNKNRESGTVIVYDINSGTFDVSAFSLSQPVFKVLSTDRNLKFNSHE